jgi:glutamine amidotransferase
MARIAIIDYRMGNLRSVQKGFEHAGVTDVVVTDDPDVVAAADGIVLPGVGAFRDAAANLRATGLDVIVRDRIAAGTPFLGICLGLQLLVDTGYEDGAWDGLGVVPGVCERIPAQVKVPHIGWNTVEYPHPCELFDGIEEGTAFYFVHSYRVVPENEAAVVGSTEYGIRFCSAVTAGPRAWAVQFHPEKSSTAGLRLLANFGGIVEGAAS